MPLGGGLLKAGAGMLPQRRTQTLSYRTSGAVSEGSAGGPVEATGLGTLTVWYRATRSPEIIAMVGADGNTVAVKGRLVSPANFPADVVTGTPLKTADGRTLTILIPPPSPLAEQEQVQGRLFYGALE